MSTEDTYFFGHMVPYYFGTCISTNVETSIFWNCHVSWLLWFDYPSVLLFYLWLKENTMKKKNGTFVWPISLYERHPSIILSDITLNVAQMRRKKFQISITTFGVKGFVRFPICRCWQVCLGLIRRWTNYILYIKLTVPLNRIWTPPDTWSRPFGTCICSTCWDQSFFRIVVIFPDYALRISLGTFSILHNNHWLVSFPSQVSHLVQKYITNLGDHSFLVLKLLPIISKAIYASP